MTHDNVTDIEKRAIAEWKDIQADPDTEIRREKWAVWASTTGFQLIEEAADVIICLLRIPGILEAINRKMAINRKRTWDVRPDGTGYHVKAALGPLPAPPTIE